MAILEREVAENLEVAGARAKYDAAARKVVAQKAILAYILKSALDEFAGIPAERIAKECIEGTPGISEAAVHQDHPDRPDTLESDGLCLNGSSRTVGMLPDGLCMDRSGRTVEMLPEELCMSEDGRIAGVSTEEMHLNGDDRIAGMPTEETCLNGDDRIAGMPTEDVSIREGTVRYDIRFSAQVPGNRERMEIIVNIEIQNDDTPGYPIPKRGIYYGARLISAQRGTVFRNQEYGAIKKVVSIWICEESASARSDTISQYHIAETCRRGTYQEPKESYDLMTIVVMRLGPKGEDSADDAIRLLSKVFSTERSPADKKTVLAEEFHIEVTEKLNREVDSMCNLSTGVYNKGVREGRAEGRTEGVLETLFGLVKDRLLSIAVAADRAGMEQTVFEKKYQEYLQGFFRVPLQKNS